MSVPDREFREIAIFPDLDASSFCFAFELIPRHAGKKGPHRTAYRLLALARELEQARESHARDEPDIHRILVEPVRSFLDDVTNGPPGVNGRPLLFLASGAGPNDPSRAVTLVRPPSWDYEFEGEVTRLHVPEERQRNEMRLRDSFCFFESGRAYYVLTLTQPGRQIDEYSAIHLEQLSLDPEHAARSEYLGFEWAGAPGLLSLLDLANARLRSLREPAASDPPNGIRDLMRPYGLLAPGQSHERFSPRHLAGLCVGIEDPTLQLSAHHAYELLDAERTGPELDLPDPVYHADFVWKSACSSSEVHQQDGNEIPRPLLAVAGLATGVPDFPYQDESEVHDSTRAISRSLDHALFIHPRFMFEVGKKWRSFDKGADSIGLCPYLFLTWMVCIHDEATVAQMEHLLEDMIYDPDGKQGALPRNRRSRADPLADVMQLLNSASNPFGHSTAVLQRNLERRLELFRWESIHQTGNLFRYAKEKAALAAVRAAMGTTGRFEEVHATLDRLENLVEDVSNLASSYAERRTNRLLGALALLGVVGVPATLDAGYTALGKPEALDYALITGVIVLLLAALFFAVRSGRRRR